MSLKIDYTTLYCTRFDFGVPLEDIFPANDIHPKLKYLFETAYELMCESKYNIRFLLKHLQGSLDDCLTFKDELVLHAKGTYSKKTSPGTILWVLRHFLGVLPIPLMPKFTNGVTFFWHELAVYCKLYFKQKPITQKKLDYEIARSLSLLPFCNYLFLHIFIHFLREIAKSSARLKSDINETTYHLVKYYYGAIFVRPYQPGFMKTENKVYFFLMYYMVLRWTEIKQVSEPVFNPQTCNRNFTETATQTTLLFPEIIIVPNPPEKVTSMSTNAATCQTDFGSDSSSKLSPMSSISDLSIEDSETTYFYTPEKCKAQHDWINIRKETADTIKKVEEYMYDDYETFQCEGFNQLGDPRSFSSFGHVKKEIDDVVDKTPSPSSDSKSSIIDKITRQGWTYTPPQIIQSLNPKLLRSTPFKKYHQTCFDENELYNCTPDISLRTSGGSAVNIIQQSSNGSYIDFKDCLDNDCSFEVEKDEEKCEKHVTDDDKLKDKKKFISLKSFKKNILNIFNITLRRRSVSLNNISSVKYEKIGTRKSSSI